MSDTVTCDSKLARIKFDDTNTQFFPVSVPTEIVFVSKQNLNQIRGLYVLQLSYAVEMPLCEVSNIGEQPSVTAGLEWVCRNLRVPEASTTRFICLYILLCKTLSHTYDTLKSYFIKNNNNNFF